ncbi:MAG: rhodanese-like domain-containing protein [Chloroflexia bacterium]
MQLFRKFGSTFFMLIIIALGTACGSTQDNAGQAAPGGAPGQVIKTEKGQYTDISADELMSMMDNKDFYLVDVHVPNEGLMPQLDARIPYNEIAGQLDKLPSDKAARIVLTCKSGGMSSEAATTLADLGYTNVYNLAGGFLAWKDKGYPLTPEP